MLGQSLLTVLATTAVATALPNTRPLASRQTADGATIKCPLIFDGRVPAAAKLADFDSNNGGGWMPFNPDYVKNQALKWSEILLLPDVATPSRFDANGTRPLEVTLNDKSIFMTQNGFRRAGLQFLKDSNNGSPANKGVVTLHFSVMQDAKRKLNLTHEYLNVWHESADYSANQIQFQTGTILGQTSLAKNTWKVMNRQNRQAWSVAMDDTAWQNFALTIDYSKNTIRTYYSKGNEPLAAQGAAVSNDNSGAGQYQIGLLKKPTGTSDVVNSGYQERNLNEGLIYGGIFIEDSTSGCVSL